MYDELIQNLSNPLQLEKLVQKGFSRAEAIQLMVAIFGKKS